MGNHTTAASSTHHRIRPPPRAIRTAARRWAIPISRTHSNQELPVCTPHDVGGPDAAASDVHNRCSSQHREASVAAQRGATPAASVPHTQRPPNCKLRSMGVPATAASKARDSSLAPFSDTGPAARRTVPRCANVVGRHAAPRSREPLADPLMRRRTVIQPTVSTATDIAEGLGWGTSRFRPTFMHGFGHLRAPAAIPVTHFNTCGPLVNNCETPAHNRKEAEGAGDAGGKPRPPFSRSRASPSCP